MDYFCILRRKVAQNSFSGNLLFRPSYNNFKILLVVHRHIWYLSRNHAFCCCFACSGFIRVGSTKQVFRQFYRHSRALKSHGMNDTKNTVQKIGGSDVFPSAHCVAEYPTRWAGHFMCCCWLMRSNELLGKLFGKIVPVAYSVDRRWKALGNTDFPMYHSLWTSYNHLWFSLDPPSCISEAEPSSSLHPYGLFSFSKFYTSSQILATTRNAPRHVVGIGRSVVGVLVLVDLVLKIVEILKDRKHSNHKTWAQQEMAGRF